MLPLKLAFVHLSRDFEKVHGPPTLRLYGYIIPAALATMMAMAPPMIGPATGIQA